MRVRFLGWEDPLAEEMATYSSVLAWEIPWTGSLGGYSPRGSRESDTTEHACTSGVGGRPILPRHVSH